MTHVDIAERIPLIKTEGLRKVYATDEVETTALNNVSLEIRSGEFIAILGPSGCGKSTLLNILGLLDQPSGGRFVFDGTDVTGYNERRRADLRRGTLGFVFQSFNLIDELTVYENVELPLLYLSLSAAERRERTSAASAWRTGGTTSRSSSPAASSSASRSRAPSSPAPSSSSPTSRRATSTRPTATR